MGFLDKMMGLGSSKSNAQKEKIRGIFNERVPNGGSYTVIAAMNLVTAKKLLKEVRTYYNYIVGYKDGDNPEIVILSTVSDLSSFEKPVFCKRSECGKAEYLPKTGSFTLTHPALGDQPLDFSVITSTAWAGYIIDVSYVDEYMPFMEFFQNRFMK